MSFSIPEDGLAPGQLGVESRADFQQAGDAAFDADLA
jgi:hypothetical protein